jgi:hypothetical protein
LPTPDPKATPNANVSVFVHDPGGKPIVGAQVFLTADVAFQMREYPPLTDAAGRWSTDDGVPAGTYTVSVEKDGYVTQTVTAPVRAPGSHTVDIVLHKGK